MQNCFVLLLGGVEYVMDYKQVVSLEVIKYNPRVKKCCLVHAMCFFYQCFGAHSLKMKNMLSTMSLYLFNVALHFVDHYIISLCCRFLPMSIQGP
jgi:hypothetical protein